MRRLLLVLPLMMIVASGCVRARANTRPPAAPLEVPQPPPRVIVPPEPEEPPEEAKAEEPEANKERRTTRPRPQPPRERAETKPPTETKEPPVVSEAAKPAVPPVPVGQLQPQLPASSAEMKRQVEGQLSQAKRDLDRIDYRALSADAKSQYDTAKRFIEQAGAALTEGNLVFAAKLAEKAVGLASNLPPR